MGAWDWKRWFAAILAALLLGWTAKWYLDRRNKPSNCPPATIRTTASQSIPGLQVISGGVVLSTVVTHFNDKPTIQFKNQTAGPLGINTVTLYENHAFVDVLSDSLPSTCRILSLTANTCASGGTGIVLAVGDSCEIEVAAGSKAITGYVDLGTTAGVARTLIDVMP